MTGLLAVTNDSGVEEHFMVIRLSLLNRLREVFPEIRGKTLQWTLQQEIGGRSMGARSKIGEAQSNELKSRRRHFTGERERRKAATVWVSA